MHRNNKIFWLLGLLLIQISLLLSACGDDAIPKPRAYFRIDIPEHEYISFDTNYPYSFEYADYSILSNAQRENHPFWLNIDYPNYKARIYLSYNHIEGNVQQMLEDAHELAFKHIAVANDIQQDLITLDLFQSLETVQLSNQTESFQSVFQIDFLTNIFPL